MFRIDHIPVGHRDGGRLAALFSALGFEVSAPCVYTSPDEPDGRWESRSVFLQGGWLDLQHQPSRPADLGAAPQSCLFRVPSIEDGAAALAPARMGGRFRLRRTWEGADAHDLELAWASVRERIAPFALALAAYPGEGPGGGAAAPAHGNGALRLLGLVFGGAAPGPAASAASAVLDLAGFRYLDAETFERRFGRPTASMTALRFEVASLDAAARALDAGRLVYRAGGGRLDVPAQGDLGFGVEFVGGGG